MRLCTAILALCFLAGCASDGREYSPYIDAMFREAGRGASGTLTLTRPALVSEVNGAYAVKNFGWHEDAALDADGARIKGANRVLTLDFTDFGDIGLLRTDDKDVSFRAEITAEGKIARGLLGAPSGTVSDGFISFGNDEFVEGRAELIYDGPDLVVGRLDVTFKKYRAQVNFRIPRNR